MHKKTLVTYKTISINIYMNNIILKIINTRASQPCNTVTHDNIALYPDKSVLLHWIIPVSMYSSDFNHILSLYRNKYWMISDKFFFPRPSDVVPYGWGRLRDMSMSPCCRYNILVHPNRPVVRSDVGGGVRASPDTFPPRGGRSMIKSHRCCPIGSEQVAVHVLLKDARNYPARIRSTDLSVLG